MSAKAVFSKELSRGRDKRWVIIEEETGKVLDDANGYGYKSVQNAYAGYSYKSKTPAQKSKAAAVDALPRWNTVGFFLWWSHGTHSISGRVSGCTPSGQKVVCISQLIRDITGLNRGSEVPEIHLSSGLRH